MTHHQLLALIRTRGLAYVNRGFADAGVRAALDDGLDLTNWRFRQSPGTILLYQVQRDGWAIVRVSAAPMILCVHGAEQERSTWEAIAAESADAPCTVVMLQSAEAPR